MATYKELVQQAEKMLAEAEKLRAKEMAQVITEIREKMIQYGLTIRDIATPELQAKSPSKTGLNPPKYRGPKGQTWAGGRGRKPDWVKAALAEGRSLDDFLIR